MAAMILTLIVTVFFVYILIRNQLVYIIRGKFIDYFYEEDHDGYAAGKRFHEVLPSYDEMLCKFWVWPLSKSYPAYRNRNRNK
ncbi:hypothetical protein KGB36_gp41 [Shigella phage Sf11 SMD-2017]|uniref:Uncharacterized protein n=1 Tax=Shigella phage Sf11 SMD-2017 TaxID=2282196 RepID=A0A291AXH3_9CAUD|nr:hypothetical protein KGB36_gp41 [Shigella phage Sf11 SMD-2017]ATE85711.1 hypothetical protein Sf11_gp64 [Shigella phage Sf11 SMD-2017]